MAVIENASDAKKAVSKYTNEALPVVNLHARRLKSEVPYWYVTVHSGSEQAYIVEASGNVYEGKAVLGQAALLSDAKSWFGRF